MRFLLSFLFCFALLACDATENANSRNNEDSGRPTVVSSNYPLFFFASQVAGDAMDAPKIALPDIEGDPANWVPTAGDIELLQSSDLVLLNGAGYESWLDWITIDDGNLINTTAGAGDKLIELQATVTHQHGPAGEHAHQGTAFTTWLDPQLAMEQAGAVASALGILAPDHEGEFSENLSRLHARLVALDTELASRFAALDGQPILFSHPVYQYLQKRYNINGVSLHWEPDVDPGVSAWIELQKIVRQHPAAIMIWEEQPIASTAERLLEMGIQSIVFQTASNRPESGDYFSIMQANADRL